MSLYPGNIVFASDNFDEVNATEPSDLTLRNEVRASFDLAVNKFSLPLPRLTVADPHLRRNDSFIFPLAVVHCVLVMMVTPLIVTRGVTSPFSQRWPSHFSSGGGIFHIYKGPLLPFFNIFGKS